MYKNSRIKQIEADLLMYGSIDVNTLSKKLNVSDMTIRRDLNTLVNQGKAVRTHGGAILPKEHYTGDIAINSRSLVHIAEKKAIAKEAVKYLNSGDSVFIDDSTTAMNMVHYIPHNIQLKITTNSIITAAEFSKLSNVELICLGGLLSRDTKSVIGTLPLEFIQQMHFKTAFLGFPYISPDGILSTNSIDEYSIKRSIMKHSERSILLIDSSKIREDKKYLQPCNIKDFDAIVMDQNASADFCLSCEQNNVSLIKVYV